MNATMSQRAENSNRTGSKGKIYTVRRDPDIDRKDIIKNKNSANKFKFIAGGTYKGDWKDNEKHGFGIEEMSSGNKYEGEWMNGKRHGMGTMWVKKGKISIKQYAGSWAHGKKDGNGVFSYENGDVYSGEWHRGNRSGAGRMDYANGDYYVGQWENDVQNGSGILNLANGNRYDGYWANGVKEGPGKFYYAATNKVSRSHTFIVLCLICVFIRNRCTKVSGWVTALVVGSLGIPRKRKRLRLVMLTYINTTLSCRKLH